MVQDDESNDGPLIVDDGSSPTTSRNSSAGRSPDLHYDLYSPSGTPVKRGRGRGRPRGSRSRCLTSARGRGTGSAALAAAELAGAQAGKNAAMAAFPFLVSGNQNAIPRSRARGRGKKLPIGLPPITPGSSQMTSTEITIENRSKKEKKSSHPDANFYKQGSTI